MKIQTKKLYRILSVGLTIFILLALSPKLLQPAAAVASELKEFDSSLFDTIPVNGWPGEIIIPDDAESLLDPNRMIPFFTPTYTIGQSTAIFNIDGGSGSTITVQLAAISTHCQVWIRAGDTQYSSFAPTDSTPHSNAAAIATEFETIYDMVTTAIGDPLYIAGTSGKINIILYDISNDSGSTSAYTAGFFYESDYWTQYGSNHDTMIYIDIGTNQGFAKFNSGAGTQARVSFFGTIAHELQHLINYSYWLKYYGPPNTLQYLTDGSDPDWDSKKSSPTDVTAWYNEGLSGLIDVMYQNSKGYGMDKSHLNYFLNGNTGAVGFIPTTNEWQTTPSPDVLGLYGASSAMMQEYYAVTGNASDLVDNPRVGYPYSLRNVAVGYSKADSIAGFNEFFTIANLNIQVDSPSAPAAPDIWYQSNVVDNIWAYKSTNGIAVTSITAGTSAAFNTAGKKYFTKTYISSAPISSGYINITVPANGEYYLITAYNTKNANTRTGSGGWDLAPKIATKLNSGVNSQIAVGKNNLFAILAIAHDASVNASFTFTAAGAPGDVNKDGKVDATDLSMLISDFGKSVGFNPDSDINKDSKVDATDLSILISNFGT